MSANYNESERTALYFDTLDKGYELLAKHGLKALNVRNIAETMGFSTGTFYNFFRSKYDYVIAVIEKRQSDAFRRMHRLGRKYRTGIPQAVLSDFLLKNIETENIYRLLSQEDCKTLMQHMPPKQPNPSYAEAFMKLLDTPCDLSVFPIFAQAYRMIVIGTSDPYGLVPEIAPATLKIMVDTATAILYRPEITANMNLST
ncbi:MAG: TetR/AcrR family transcriptional regulator [Eubacteriales bacterium]|nr:TetR/AcrR family transcriptional regulator [Eubacteriales bacterium]